MQSGNMGWEKDGKRGNFIRRKETDDDGEIGRRNGQLFAELYNSGDRVIPPALSL